MIDTIYNILIILSAIFSFVIEGYHLNKFYKGILKVESIKQSKRKNKTMIVLLGYMVSMMVLKYIPIVMESSFAYSIGILTAAGLSYMVYKGDTVLKLYVSVTFMAIRYLVHYLVFDITELLFAFINNFEYYLNLNESRNHFMWNILNFIFYLIILRLFQWLILGFIISIIIRKFEKKKASFTFSEAVLLIVPSITGMFAAYL